MLGGKARCCDARIGPLHLQVELACLLVGLLAGLAAGGSEALVIAAAGWLLVLIAALDATEFWIPDPLVAVLAAGGLAAALILPPSVPDRLTGGVAGFGALWLIGFGYRHARGVEGLGGADPKLFGALGLWLGWQVLPAVLLSAALVGLGVVAVRVVSGRGVARDDALPFGTFLAVAAYPALLLMVYVNA